MRWMIATLIALFMAAPATNAQAELLLNVTLDYDQERDYIATQGAFNDLARYLSSDIGQPVKLVMTQNAERVGERIRTNAYSLLLAPAQLVGLAMRNGYIPVAKTKRHTRVVLVARNSAHVESLEAARGKRIALPHQESLVSYMFKGEMNALGLSPSTYFGRIMHMTLYGAVLYAMEIGQADLAVLPDDEARDWINRKHSGVILKTFPEVPSAGVVVSNKVDEHVRDKIRSAFARLDKDLEKRLRRVKFGGFDLADAQDFEYVSTRGFFNPEILPGATIVTAEQVRKLMAQGVPLFDVRPAAHRLNGYIPGSISVPYEMNSLKEADDDDSVDHFDLSKLPQDKNAPMIFQCNGAECWFSYKASRYVIKRGYKRIYWFRSGLPAWKAAGYPVHQGS